MSIQGSNIHIIQTQLYLFTKIKFAFLLLLQIAKGEVKGWPKAADMRQLKWSDELAVVAQRHADQCTFAHDKFKQRYYICEEMRCLSDIQALLCRGTTAKLSFVPPPGPK